MWKKPKYYEPAVCKENFEILSVDELKEETGKGVGVIGSCIGPGYVCGLYSGGFKFGACWIAGAWF